MYSASVILNEVNNPSNILDKWILAKLQELIEIVEKNMGEYKLVDASRPILDFITDLSQWYVRRSRDRFKGENLEDKKQAIATLREVLLTLSKVMAPFTPFIADRIYLALTDGKTSVHLVDWPEVNKDWVSEEVLREMILVRRVVELGLSIRAESGIKVKQPLSELVIRNLDSLEEHVEDLKLDIGVQSKQIILEELNVKKITDWIKEGSRSMSKTHDDITVGLNLDITPELKKEGLVREIIRTINQTRKDLKLTVSDVVTMEYNTSDESLAEILNNFSEEIKKQTLTKEIVKNSDLVMDKKIDGMEFGLSIK